MTEQYRHGSLYLICIQLKVLILVRKAQLCLAPSILVILFFIPSLSLPFVLFNPQITLTSMAQSISLASISSTILTWKPILIFLPPQSLACLFFLRYFRTGSTSKRLMVIEALYKMVKYNKIGLTLYGHMYHTWFITTIIIISVIYSRI